MKNRNSTIKRVCHKYSEILRIRLALTTNLDTIGELDVVTPAVFQNPQIPWLHWKFREM